MDPVSRPEHDVISNHQRNANAHYQSTTAASWDGGDFAAPSDTIPGDTLQQHHQRSRERGRDQELEPELEGLEGTVGEILQFQAAASITQPGSLKRHTYPAEPELALQPPAPPAGFHHHDQQPNDQFHRHGTTTTQVRRGDASDSCHRDLNGELVNRHPGVQAGVSGQAATAAYFAGVADYERDGQNLKPQLGPDFHQDEPISNAQSGIIPEYGVVAAVDPNLNSDAQSSLPRSHRQHPHQSQAHQDFASPTPENFVSGLISRLPPHFGIALHERAGLQVKQQSQLLIPVAALTPHSLTPSQAPLSAPRYSGQAASSAPAPAATPAPQQHPFQGSAPLSGSRLEGSGVDDQLLQSPHVLQLPVRSRETSHVAPGQTGPMRYNKGDLAILSAELYDDGGHFPPSRRPPRSKKTHQSSDPPTGEDGPRKRARVASEDDAEKDDDDKKRSRGRPRLDTKDETTAERRRTQIRLAQRAYRSRKENAIQMLEKKVQTLRYCNEEMNQAFKKLQQFAMGNQLLKKSPEFERQLQATSVRFSALVRRSEEENGKDDDPETGTKRDSMEEQLQGTSPESDKAPALEVRSQSPPVHPFGAYVVSYEADPREDLMPQVAGSFDALVPTTQAPNIVDVTYPTFENASFPFGQNVAPPMGTDFNNFSIPGPYNPLPLPSSCSGQEATFGRRLNRFILERGYLILNMEHLSMERMRRIFGWCMQYEEPQDMKRRFEDCLSRTAQESYSHWQSPFHHLAGTGTHYSSKDAPQRRMGNEGTVDVLRPRASAGYGMGPFNEKITAAREKLDKGFRMNLPGFEGEMLDPEEVERYLYSKGVSFPAHVDTVVVEVDLANFQDSDTSNNQTTSTGIPPRGTMVGDFSSIPGFDTTSAFSNVSQSSGPISPSSAGDGTTHTAPTPRSSSSEAWNRGGPDALLGDTLSSMATTNSYLAAGTAPDFGVVAFPTMTGSSSMQAANGSVAGFGFTNKRFLINVNSLAEELVERVRCLGRSPGFRKCDIDASFLRCAEPYYA